MKILIVDDNTLILEDLIDEVSKLYPDAFCVGTGEPEKALELFNKYRFNIVLMDIDLPGENGITLAQKMLDIASKTNIIYITGYEKYALESYNTYASAFLVKPINTKRLSDAMSNLRHPISGFSDKALEDEYTGKIVIGRIIEKAREDNGMTKKDLAKAMEVSLQTVYRWENGERIPSTLTLMRLSRVLNISYDELTSE